MTYSWPFKSDLELLVIWFGWWPSGGEDLVGKGPPNLTYHQDQMTLHRTEAAEGGLQASEANLLLLILELISIKKCIFIKQK